MSRESELSILTIQYRSSTLSRPDQHISIMSLESAIRLMFGSPCVSCSYRISHELPPSNKHASFIHKIRPISQTPKSSIIAECNCSILQHTVSRSLNRMCSHQSICSYISIRSCRMRRRMSHWADIRDVQKTVFILVLFVYAAHQGSSRR